MKNEYILVTVTFDNEEEADRTIDALLEKRLVSCCQKSNIVSKYHWKGNIETTPEFFVQMKSKKSLFKEIEKVVLENHSYEVPQIVAYDIVAGLQSYLDWIEEETV